MGSSTLGFRVEDDIITTLEDTAAANGVSKSQIAREAMLIGLEEMEGSEGDLEIPEHLSHDAKIRRLISDNKRVRRQGKFRSEFVDQLKRSFENGEHPSEFRQSVAGYVEEAEDMGDLPEQLQAELEADTFSEWVQDKLEYYATAYQASNWDAEPIENPLENYAGVANAGEWLDRAEAIAKAADDPTQDETKMARFALKDGVAPEEVSTPAEVCRAAVEVVDMTRALEEGDQ